MTTTLSAAADTTLRQQQANQNRGDDELIRLGWSQGSRALVRFDQGGIAAAVGSGTLVSAHLELWVDGTGESWGNGGQNVGAHRLTAAWTESGATWNCAIDSKPSDNKADCNPQWQGGSFVAAATATVSHTKQTRGLMRFDVTADVAAFLAGTANRGWLLKKANEALSGRIDYVSREGEDEDDDDDDDLAAPVRDHGGSSPTRPRLVLVVNAGGAPDTTAPAVAITAPAGGARLATARPTIAATYSDGGSGIDPATARLTVDGTDLTAGATVTATGLTFTPTAPLVEGAHTVQVTVRDRAGNAGSATLSFLTDTLAPVVTFTAPEGPAVTDDLAPEIDVTYSDDGGVAASTFSITLDGLDLTPLCTVGPVSATCLPAPLALGPHTATARVRDPLGHEGTGSLTFEIADADDPTLVVVAPEDGAVTRSASLTVEGSAFDASGLAVVTVNGQTVTVVDGGFSTTVALSEGNNPIVVAARDVAGKTTTQTVTVALDTRPPALTLDEPTEGQPVNGGFVRVVGHATDERELQGVEVDGVSVSVLADRFETEVPVSAGPRSISVRAFDSAGNERSVAVGVRGFELPDVTIDSPADLAFLATTTVDVTGHVSAGSTVAVNGVAAEISGDTFTVHGLPLIEGGNPITATARSSGGTAATVTINVVRDLTAPRLSIDRPLAGAPLYSEVTNVSGLVNDVVPGTVNDSEVRVRVNGRPAEVKNRSFLATGVPLVPGTNTIEVEATDESGNVGRATLSVVRAAADVAHISVASGDLQNGTAGVPLGAPLVAQLADAAGLPVAGRTVVFVARGNDGRFPGASGALGFATATSDAAGRAALPFTLGHHSGVQVVEATSAGFAGLAVFTAQAAPGEPSLIVLDDGGLQNGTAGRRLPRPLIAAVTDAGSNRLEGIAVRFAVVRGTGTFENGASSILVSTDSDGRAVVPFTLDPTEGIANNAVEATIAGVPASPVVTFTATGRAAGDPAATSVSGLLQDNEGRPVPGATLRIRDSAITARSDAQGAFRIPGAPVGTIQLIVDGSTVTRPGSWPDLEYTFTTVAGRDNTVERPIFLLPIDLSHGVLIDETHGGAVTLPQIPGFSLEIAPGSVTFPGGSRSGFVSATLVHSDRVPMAPNFGQQPRFIVTIQPAGARFDPPARLTLPNVDDLAPNQVTELYSFDHDLGHFVSIGPATVSADGRFIVSNPGVGVIKAGWHCGGNPQTAGTTHNCAECEACINGTCQRDPNAPAHCVQIKIDRPAPGMNFDITTAPEMPNSPAVEAQAHIEGADPDPTASTDFTWKIELAAKISDCDTRVRSDRTFIHPTINDHAVGGRFTPTWTQIRGGKLKITASATIDGQAHQAVRDERVAIRGSNPGKAAVQSALPNDALRQIACQETGQKQFSAAPDGGIDKCPCWSRDHLGGVGVFQLTPAPGPNEVWNWRSNVTAGIAKLTSTNTVARQYPGLVRGSTQFRDLVNAYNAQRVTQHLRPLVRVDVPEFTTGNLNGNFLERERDAIRGFNGFGGPVFLQIPRGGLHEYRLVLDATGNLVLNVDETNLVGAASWEVVPVAARGGSGDPNYVANVLAKPPTCENIDRQCAAP